MRENDVRIGRVYWTKVSSGEVRVRVIYALVSFPRVLPIRFKLRRLDNGKMLPKLRTAAALHLQPLLSSRGAVKRINAPVSN